MKADWHGGIGKEEFCPRIFTDWHGLFDEGLPEVVLSFSAIEVSGYPGMSRKSAVPADWERIFTEGLKKKNFAHGLAWIYVGDREFAA